QELLLQLGQDLIEQRQRPAAREQLFRRRRVGGLQAVPALGGAEVQRQACPTAAALAGVGPVALVGQAVLAGRQQERPEFALLAVYYLQVVLFQQPGEELLGQVLGLVRPVPLPADEGVEGIPVGPAQGGEGFTGPRRGLVSGGEDQAPLCGREPPRGGGWL